MRTMSYYLAHSPPPLVPISTPFVVTNNQESQSNFSFIGPDTNDESAMSYLANSPPPLVPISPPFVIINEESQSCFTGTASAPHILPFPRLNSNYDDSLVDEITSVENCVTKLMVLVNGIVDTLSRMEDWLKNVSYTSVANQGAIVEVGLCTNGHSRNSPKQKIPKKKRSCSSTSIRKFYNHPRRTVEFSDKDIQWRDQIIMEKLSEKIEEMSIASSIEEQPLHTLSHQEKEFVFETQLSYSHQFENSALWIEEGSNLISKDQKDAESQEDVEKTICPEVDSLMNVGIWQEESPGKDTPVTTEETQFRNKDGNVDDTTNIINHPLRDTCEYAISDHSDATEKGKSMEALFSSSNETGTAESDKIGSSVRVLTQDTAGVKTRSASRKAMSGHPNAAVSCKQVEAQLFSSNELGATIAETKTNDADKIVRRSVQVVTQGGAGVKTRLASRKQAEKIKSANGKLKKITSKATRKDVFVKLSEKKINKLLEESNSCVKFIGHLLLASFPKNYFIQHRFKDITPWQLNKLYGIVLTKFSEIRRANRASVPVTLEEVSAVIRHKTINFRSEIIAINNVFFP